MTARQVPFHAVRGSRSVVAAADQLAAQAGMFAFARGGNAVDAAIAANAALAVTGPHLCGMGGDLFAIVSTPGGELVGLNASGRAGSGADAAALRDEGFVVMPFRGDLRSVTIPGCVDGWIALHERFGMLDLDVVLTPAIRLAAGGFPAGPLLALVVTFLDEAGRRELHELADQAVRPGAVVRRPGVALSLQSIARGGRAAFYGGAFGEGLVHRGAGLFTEADLDQCQADWVDVLSTDVFDVELCSLPPNSQGYLTLGMTRLAADTGLPTDPDEALWAHLLIEAATASAYDRPARLHEGADGENLVNEIIRRGELLDLAGAFATLDRHVRGRYHLPLRCGHRRMGSQSDPIERFGLRLVSCRADNVDQPAEPRSRILPGRGSSGGARPRAAAAPHAVPCSRPPRRARCRRARDDGR